MLFLDIDGTISPPHISDDLRGSFEWEEHRCYGFNVEIATYLLDFLRSTRAEVALLSTWGQEAMSVAVEFGFPAQVFLPGDQGGVEGKFATILDYHAKNPSETIVWCDDHIKDEMLEECELVGIETFVPDTDKGLTPSDLDAIRKLVHKSAPQALQNAAETLSHMDKELDQTMKHYE